MSYWILNQYNWFVSVGDVQLLCRQFLVFLLTYDNSLIIDVFYCFIIILYHSHAVICKHMTLVPIQCNIYIYCMWRVLYYITMVYVVKFHQWIKKSWKFKVRIFYKRQNVENLQLPPFLQYSPLTHTLIHTLTHTHTHTSTHRHTRIYTCIYARFNNIIVMIITGHTYV